MTAAERTQMTSHPPLTSALELLVSRPVSPSRCNSSDGEHTDADGLGLSEQIQRLQATLHETELALRRERDRACMLEQEVKRLLRDKPVSRSPSAQDLNPLSEPGDEESGADVTIPRREHELLLLKKRALDSIKEGITIADCSQPDMPIIYANEAFARLTGYSTEYAIGRNCRFLQGEGTDPVTVNELRAAIHAGKPCVVQLVNYKRNGDPFMNYLSLTPVIDADGKLTHFVGVQADVTELIMSKNAELAAKNAAVQAAAATEAKSQFLARMSHEIRTPLNGMIAVGELLAETPLSPAQWDLVNTIRCSGETLLTLITDILDFSRIEANKMVLSSTRFQLQTVVEAAMEIAGLKAAQKRLHVAYHITEDVPRSIILDAQRLQQILLNILNNAVKFTERGEILLEVWCRPPSAAEAEAARRVLRSSAQQARGSGGRRKDRGREGDLALGGQVVLEFSVTDTGIGIGQADLGRLFKSFSQVDASPTRRYGGSGLGLAISKKLCEAMGGSMTAHSAGLGRGTCFQWTVVAGLPAVREGPGPGPALSLGEAAAEDRAVDDGARHKDRVLGMLRGKKLLVVERNTMLREVLTRALVRWGCHVVAVASEAEAVKHLCIPESVQQMLLEEYEGSQTLSPGAAMGQGQLRLQHAPPLREQPGEVEGPFDVVVADADAGLLLHGLIAAEPEEANRIIFMAYPGQPNPVYPPKTPTCINDCDSSCSSRYSQLWSDGTSLTAVTDGEASAPRLNQGPAGLQGPLTPPASPAPTHFLLAEGAVEVPLLGSRAARQVGYVVVPRPLRQGRLKLALEEVLSVLMPTSAAGSPVGGALQEQRAPLSMLGTSQVRCNSTGDLDTLMRTRAHELRIMLAEDNPINMKVACGILRRLGYEHLVTVTDGQQALDEIEQRGGGDAFDVILTDLHMPFKGGMEVALEVRRQYPTSPMCLVAVTADAFDDTRDTCLASGFDDWLPKPFRVEDMVRIMRRCMGKLEWRPRGGAAGADKDS